MRRACCWLALCGALGCGRAAPAHYSGRVELRRAEPEALVELGAPSSEYVAIGSVAAACTLRSGFRALDGEPLSDLDCSFRRLGWVLRESAAAAGGEAIVAERCTQSARGLLRRLDCRASVARHAGPDAERSPRMAPRSSAPARPAPSPRDVERIDEPDASLAARIRLDFTPRVADFEGEARGASNVRELAELPVWDLALGDVRARCAGVCSEAALRHALLIAAGRLGAPDVVGVRCAALDGDTACLASLATPESAR